MKYFSKLFIPLFFLFLLASCGTTSNITQGLWKAENVSWETYKKIEVGKCENKTGLKFNFNITENLKQSIDDKIKNIDYSNYQNSSESQLGTLIAENEIIYYIPGDAGTRWLLGGFSGMVEGAITEFIVRTRLFDKSDKKIIADFITNAEIGSDLFGSPGGDNKIINDVATSIANNIIMFIKPKK